MASGSSAETRHAIFFYPRRPAEPAPRTGLLDSGVLTPVNTTLTCIGRKGALYPPRFTPS